MATRVAITGIGPISPDGTSVKALARTTQPIPSPTESEFRPLSNFDVVQFLGKRGHKYLTPATRYALSATAVALEDAHIPDSTYSPEESGVVLGTNCAVSSIWDAVDRTILTQGAEYLQPMEAANFSVNLPSSTIALKHQCRAFSLTLTSLLVAGLEAVALGAQAIQTGRASFVFAGATEGLPPKELVPYMGGSISEGGACLLCLEPLSAVLERQAHAYAYVGQSLFRFIPPEMLERDDGELVLREIITRYLLTLQLEAGEQLPVGLQADYCRLSSIAQSILVSCLDAQGISVRVHRTSHTPEICVSPLLQAAGLAVRHGCGLVMATSPEGHLALLHLEPASSDRTIDDDCPGVVSEGS